MSDDESVLWDVARLAWYLGYAERTIARKARKNPESLPPRVPGVRFLWRPEEVDAWASGQLPTPSEAEE